MGLFDDLLKKNIPFGRAVKPSGKSKRAGKKRPSKTEPLKVASEYNLISQPSLKKEIRLETPPHGSRHVVQPPLSDHDLQSQQESQMWLEKEEDDTWEEYRLEQARQRDQEIDAAWEIHDAVCPSPPIDIPITPVYESKQDEERRAPSMDDEELFELEDDGDDERSDEDSIDNSKLSDDLCSQLNTFAIRLNDERDWYEQRANRLQSSEKNLCKRYPLFSRIDAEDRLPMMINTAFPDGMQRNIFIRNLSFDDNNRDAASLGIRPEILPGSQLFEILGEGNSLIFIGHIRGREFVVDRIMDAAQTECLPYEVECVAIAYADSSRVDHNNVQFLYDIRERAASLTEYTKERLTEWKEYLRWREEIVKKQIKGCKYFRVTLDEHKVQLIFHLVFESREHFLQFKKYLYKDIQAFSNDYSKNEWHFEFAYDENKGRKRSYRSVEIGRFRGIRNEYLMQTGFDACEDADAENADSESVAFSEMDTAEYGDHWNDEIIDDSEDSGEVSESAILREYRTPYIVEAAYEVSSFDADQMRDLEDEDMIPYIYSRVLPRYDGQGFLALSAVGQFSVIERQKRAVQQLERGDSFSPNLSAWIFNVKQARLPVKTDYKVQKWLNPAIAANENQRKAVEGMLCTEDVCLVQGPPGTGKTTVIAEAVYQFVSQGKRVLIASQSNDAVDNALERLADTTEIRAIRMGQAGRHKRRGGDFVEGKFSEESSLKNYFHTLSDKIADTWLNPWEDLQSRAQQYERDLRDLQLLVSDVEEFHGRRRGCEERIRSLQSEIHAKRMEKNDADEFNSETRAEKSFFEQFKRTVEKEGSEFLFSLSARQLKIVGECVDPVVRTAQRDGVLIVPHGLNADQLGIDGANNSLALSFYQISQIKGVIGKIALAKQSVSGQSVEADRLRAEIDRLQRLMDEAEEEEAESYFIEYKKKKRMLRNLGQTQSALILSNAEKALFEPKFTAQIEGAGKDEAVRILNEVLVGWERGIGEAIQRIEHYLDSKNVIDLAPIDSELKRLEGQIVRAQEDLNQTALSLEQKQRQLAEMGRRYGVHNGDSSEIGNRISKLLDDNKGQARQQARMREDWEDTLRSFSSRLDDDALFPCDSEYYLPIYIQSCNVVGTSCTDRILTGSELGDFDVVIIDEVSKATPPELLLPLMKARKAILVGDHRQLPPMFEEHEKSYSEIVQNEDLPEELKELLTVANFNRFKKMVTASLFKDMFESANERIKYSLLTQYRMHKDIMDVINRFYDNRLERGLNDEQEARQKNHNLLIRGLDSGSLITPDSHAYWLDSSTLPSGKPVYDSFYYSKGNSRSTSAFNALEYYMIIELLKKLDEANKAAGGNKKTVGVISFYQRQINELRNEVKRMRKQLSSLDIDINTVDRFQGKEKQIIITSLVRNNPQARAGQHVAAFERINVAFSRAQELLVIVGARHMYENLQVQLPNMTDKGTSTVAVYKNIISLMERKASFKTTAKLLRLDMEDAILTKCREDGDSR